MEFHIKETYKMSGLFKQFQNKTRFQKSNILTFSTVDVGNGAGGDGEQENPSVKPSKSSFSLIGCHWEEKSILSLFIS